MLPKLSVFLICVYGLYLYGREIVQHRKNEYRHNREYKLKTGKYGAFDYINHVRLCFVAMLFSGIAAVVTLAILVKDIWSQLHP